MCASQNIASGSSRTRGERVKQDSAQHLASLVTAPGVVSAPLWLVKAEPHGGLSVQGLLVPDAYLRLTPWGKDFS